MNDCKLILVVAAATLAGLTAQAEIKVTVDHNPNGQATAEFKFKHVPSPSTNDVATGARFVIAEGERDDNSGDLAVLNDGKLPTEQDQPDANFFFDAGTEGGRLLLDLNGPVNVQQVNTYSWHPNTRGPQIYKLYASDGAAGDFNGKPGRGIDPEKCGWKLIAKVNTAPKTGDGGGQWGVSISDTNGALGKYRYLLFDVVSTEDDDEFGNTFYSEIDVIGQK
jgi:hypothetical protein